MLLHPEGDQQRRKVMANGREPVDAGVAGGAEGNEPFEGVLARATVMYMDPPRIRMRRSAALTRTPVAEKNRLAMTAETALRIPETHLAEPAEVGAGYLNRTARTEEAALGGHGVRMFLTVCGGATRWKSWMSHV